MAYGMTSLYNYYFLTSGVLIQMLGNGQLPKGTLCYCFIVLQLLQTKEKLLLDVNFLADGKDASIQLIPNLGH